MAQYTYLYAQGRPEQACGISSVLIKPGVMINTTPQVYICLLDNNLIKLLVLEYTLAGIEQNLFKTCTTNEVLRYTLIIGISAVSPIETYTFKGYELNAVDYVCTPMKAVLRANYFTLPGSVICYGGK
jgi:hypothetical protein